MLLGNDDGEGCASPAHVLQSLGQGHFCVEEDEVHHHARISHLPPYHFCVLSTGSQTKRTKCQQFNKCVNIVKNKKKLILQACSIIMKSKHFSIIWSWGVLITQKRTWESQDSLLVLIDHDDRAVYRSLGIVPPLKLFIVLTVQLIPPALLRPYSLL